MLANVTAEILLVSLAVWRVWRMPESLETAPMMLVSCASLWRVWRLLKSGDCAGDSVTVNHSFRLERALIVVGPVGFYDAAMLETMAPMMLVSVP